MRELFAMRMLFVVLLAVCGGKSNAAAQEVAKSIELPLSAKTITEAGEGPIRVERRMPDLVGQSSVGKMSYFFFNRTQTPIRAFSCVIDDGGNIRLAVSLYNKGARPETSLVGGTFSDQKDPRFTFDWVLFTDGSTWGPDDHGRSREILGYFKGWHTAAARAAELVGYPNSEPLKHSLDGPWMTSWGIELPLKTERGEKDYFRKGYEKVISDLLHDREISKLKLPKQITDHLKKEMKEIHDVMP
jgi:hypothetical protein